MAIEIVSFPINSMVRVSRWIPRATSVRMLSTWCLPQFQDLAGNWVGVEASNWVISHGPIFHITQP